MRRRAKGRVILVPEDGWSEAPLLPHRSSFAVAAAVIERAAGIADKGLPVAVEEQPAPQDVRGLAAGAEAELEARARRAEGEAVRAREAQHRIAAEAERARGIEAKLAPERRRLAVAETPERRVAGVARSDTRPQSAAARRAAVGAGSVALLLGAFALGGGARALRPSAGVELSAVSSVPLQEALGRARRQMVVQGRVRQRSRSRRARARRERAARERARATGSATPEPVVVPVRTRAAVIPAPTRPARSAAALEFAP